MGVGSKRPNEEANGRTESGEEFSGKEEKSKRKGKQICNIIPSVIWYGVTSLRCIAHGIRITVQLCFAETNVSRIFSSDDRT